MRLLLAALVGLALVAVSCGGGSGQSVTNPPPQVSISLSVSTVTAGQDGTAGSVTVTVNRSSGDTSSVTLTASSVPTGVNTEITSPGSGDSGTVTFTPQMPGAPAAGSYAVTISGSNGSSVATANLTLVIAVVATVQSTINTNVGEGGVLNAFMSTSFQPAEWDDEFFINSPEPGTTITLNNLNSQHIRLQPVSQGTPESTQNNWDFSTLDRILTPVIHVADNSPELQLAAAPSWMDNASGQLDPSHYQDFADYAADVVEYYNTSTGFTDANGVNHVHSASAANVTPVTWWGIFNEPNINGLDASQYVSLYNTVVPAMQAAQSQVPLKFVAVELADFGTEPEKYMPTFVAGVTQQVDAVATHFYSTCNQADSDTQIFSTIPGFVADVNYIYSQLKTNAALAHVPVWVLENNVNADYDKGGGISACNGGPFTLDKRGTSVFFAAWRPYVFSQLTQAGAQALYHWDFDADQQYGEVDYNTGNTFLSYWVDYWLQRYYPACESCVASADGLRRAVPAVATSFPISSILNLTSTESTTVETLATTSSTNGACGVSFVVMIANHAVNAAADNNGPGAPRTVIVDVSALGPLASATQLTIDASTDPTQGPSAAPITPASRITVTLNGYGVTFLQLVPPPPKVCPA